MIETVESRPVAGVMWMVVTGLLMVSVTALIKHMGPRMPAAEAAFLRYAIGLVWLVPVIRPLLRARLTRTQLGTFGIRGLMHTGAVALWFYAMARIPIADVTAMGYLAPIYVTVGAALFLGERLAMRRILAVVVALTGAVIILRPGLRELGPGHLAMLVTAVFFAISHLLAKQLSDRVEPLVMVAMLSITVTLGLLPMAAMVWITPTLEEIAILALVSLVATAGHYTMMLAYRAAPLMVTQPVTFLQLVYAIALGVWVFNESVDVWVLVGGGLILSAISFMTWREAMLKRRAVTPAVMATKM